MLKISKSLLRKTGRTVMRYNLIKEGDKILLGLSGGKDSILLAHALKHLQRVSPIKFEFKAVTISYGMGESYEDLKAHCAKHEIDHEIYNTKIYELLKEKTRKNSSICSFCSRLRRGALYTYAKDNGYEKLALGHHLDDAVESFFMNFSYNGALRSMPPVYKADNGLEVIRPFIHVRERQLIDQEKEHNIPVVDEKSCPALSNDIKTPVNRAKTKEMLAKMEAENNELFISLKTAFENINLSSFSQEEYLER